MVIYPMYRNQVMERVQADSDCSQNVVWNLISRKYQDAQYQHKQTNSMFNKM